MTRYHRWLAILGDIGYNLLVRVNAWLSRLRRLLRRPGYWSLAGYAKSRVKRAVSFIFDFEDALIRAVRERGLDGVICGHIHSAALRAVDGTVYVNCGDWVDSCSAVVEHHDGRLELLRAWQPDTAALPAAAARTAVAPAPTLDGLPQAAMSCNANAIRP